MVTSGRRFLDIRGPFCFSPADLSEFKLSQKEFGESDFLQYFTMGLDNKTFSQGHTLSQSGERSIINIYLDPHFNYII